MTKGVILLNLGTPEAPTPEKVRDYLAEFLMDGLVIDIPTVFRWLLVHGVILRTRPARSAEAYRKVWTDRGSPLLFHLQDLAQGVQTVLKDRLVVPAMRYGQPSIESALKRLRDEGVSEALVLPLYPQYSLAATESSIVETRAAASEYCG